MKHHLTRLKNGLRIASIPMKDSPSVTAMVLVETGSHYESKNERGLSHFLEHMCFKGTKKRPKTIHIATELEGLGASSNAFTSNEYTGYYIKSSRIHWKKSLEILSDIYLNPIFSPEDIENERGVILSEMSMYEDKPERKVWEIAENLLYGDTPAGYSIIGTRENVKRFKREDLVLYRNKHYVASKTIVVISGPISHQEVLKEVQKNFKDIRVAKASSKKKVVSKQKETQIKINTKKTSQSHLGFLFPAYHFKDKRRPALEILLSVLGGGASGRLWNRLREKMGACYYIFATREEGSDYGMVGIGTGVEASRVSEVSQAILEECERLKNELVSEAELLKAKEYNIGQLHLSLETSSSLAEYYGSELLYGKTPVSPQEWEKSLRAVTPKEVQAVARDIFKAEKLNFGAVGNFKLTQELKRALIIK